ncbi:sterol 3-beta-glucosyltransferase UGT80B1 isoform X1 [Prunus persica]|uniref:sterol 3-beta-glucosyltransferase UGT80B1 isoform X1 n=1 Tax=Prunus persica TaxID=3760 RepID=UPI0009AB633E|nr:sterol 3-beta-glucosyltransferase UGT80B1 isoform X1 [Prunus persica]
MGSNGVDHPLKDLVEESVSSQEQSSFREQRNQKTNSSRHTSVLEIFQSKEINVGSSPQRGLDHYITAPIGTPKGLLIEDHEIKFSRSMTEKKGLPRHDFKLDRLSEREKKKLIVEMVKIQNDGTVEVDLEKSAPVASELLELQSIEDVPVNLDNMTSSTTKSIPRLKIAILVVGTRGDVQPFLAMAKRFQEFGHHVRLATHANFSAFVKSAGVDFYPLGGDPRVLAGYMARNKGLIPSGPAEISIQRKQLKAIIESLLPACTEPDIETGVPFKAQAIIANPPAYGHAHVAEALGVPLHIFFTMPWTPTYEFPHPLARVPQSAGYWLSYIVVDLLIWWGIRGYINDFRKKKLKLAPIAYFSTYHGSISHLPTGYMWSPHVVPKPSDWGPLVDVVGYCFLNLGSKHQPQDEFVQWIQKGSKPIYIGFGSMPLEDPKKTTEIILEALKDTGQRGIIDRGWGDLGNFTEASDNVFLLEDCPHDWLFPQCSAVVSCIFFWSSLRDLLDVHHGGAGTTATGLRAGCPTTIVPFFGDQFFWGERIHEKGLGPAPIPISQLSVESLSNAIRFMLEPEVKSRVLEIAKLIENEDGVAAAVDAFHRQLPPVLPMPTSSSEEDELPNPFVWFFLQLEKWCCLPCGL